MMQDDYLFDRTGSDAELERLEDLLAVYRYTEDGPPKLPAATREAGKSSRWKFSFSFAFAGACTAVVVVTLWIVAISRLSGPETAFVVSEPAAILPKRPNVVPEPIVPVADPAGRSRQDGLRPVLVSVRPEPVRRRAERPRPDLRRKPETVVLTKEEKQAYDQLMLALSIAGSKLKVVHDTIQGIEDPESPDARDER